MSAWMVSKAHIDALVRVALEGPKDGDKRCWTRPYFRNELLKNDLANELGHSLAKENLLSIHARYPDTIANPKNVPGPLDSYWLRPYQYLATIRHLTCAESLKAIDCYEYQACEHAAWQKSEAYAFCQMLRSHVISCLPGYEAAPWGIDQNDYAA